MEGEKEEKTVCRMREERGRKQQRNEVRSRERVVGEFWQVTAWTGESG